MRNRERLIEVLRSVNGEVWPSASATLIAVADVLEGREVDDNQELRGTLQLTVAAHQSPHIRSLAADALHYLEPRP